MFEETKTKLESKEIELKLEVEARMNREMQIREMEDTLNKETERAQDLKVRSLSHYIIWGDMIQNRQII
jgi:hypothetical protein